MHTMTMCSDVSACGQRVGCASTVSRVTVLRSSTNSGLSASSTVSLSSAETCEGGETDEGSCTFPTEDTNATISMPYASFRYFSAIAPAATRPTRSLDGLGRLLGRGALTDRLARAAATAAAARLDAVLLEIGPVCVAGAGVEVRFRIVLRPLVLVADEEPDGGPEGDTVLDARLEVHEVLFVSLERDLFNMSRGTFRGGDGRTGVVRLLWPGLLLLSCVCTSCATNGRPYETCSNMPIDPKTCYEHTGGHPSIIAPTEAQCDSP